MHEQAMYVHAPLCNVITSGSYSRLASKQSNEILVNSKIFKTLYLSHYWNFYGI